VPPADLTAGLDYVRLHLVLERLFGLLRRDSQSPGLSLTAASTLRNLELNGPRRLTDLAADESVTQPAMTQLVSRLERDGLAERTTDPADGRVVLVRVTPAGTAHLQRRRAMRAGHLADLLATLDEDDERLIAAALPALERLGSITGGIA
jgi:DNA-binding MarR family transcriptional regulator